MRRQEKKLRVTVQLNDAQSGYHIWSQTYDRDLGDIFTFRMISPIRWPTPYVQMLARSRQVRRGRDREAYNLYLLGRFHRSKPDQPAVRKAMAFFEQAIHKDSAYAAAYAGLAECYMKLAQGNSCSRESLGSGPEGFR